MIIERHSDQPGSAPAGCRRDVRWRGPGSVIGTLILAVAAACSPAARAPVQPPVPEPYEEGIASWYGPGFEGRRTASGEVFDPDALTAAHRRLAFGTRVRVINLENGRDVVVRINDRGPARDDRVIDVSRAAADALGMLRAGIVRVRLFIQR